MLKRKLLDCQISPLAIGTGRLASLGSGRSRKDAELLIATAVELGINLIDTADTYASTQCEQLLGDLLSSYPGKFLVSTKAGFPYVEMPGPLSVLNQLGKKVLQKTGKGQNFSGGYLAKCIDGSLRRLRRDTLDFFFLHYPQSAVWDDEPVLKALLDAKAAGKIRHAGVVSDTPEILRCAARVPLLEVFQLQIHPAMRHARCLPALIGVGRGDCVLANHVFGGKLMAKPQVAAVAEVAAELGVATADVLVAFAASQPGVVSVVTGTGNPEHLNQNARTLDLNMSAEKLDRMWGASSN